jgi:hypothetical protein
MDPLAGGVELQTLAEPARRSMLPALFAAVSLPPGKARLRRRIVVAFLRLKPLGIGADSFLGSSVVGD